MIALADSVCKRNNLSSESAVGVLDGALCKVLHAQHSISSLCLQAAVQKTFRSDLSTWSSRS